MKFHVNINIKMTTIQIKTSDDKIFTVSKDVVMLSTLIKNMVSDLEEDTNSFISDR
jgi:hypothetical protein